MSEFVTLRNPATGDTWECPNDPAVVDDQIKKGFILHETDPDPRDPKYGTYDGDDYAEPGEGDASTDTAGDEQADPEENEE